MQGLELTFAVLGRTRNEAAVDVLLSALQGPAECRELALRTLLGRNEPRTPAKLLACWSNLDDHDLEILRKRKAWFTDAIRSALQRSGEDVIANIIAAESLQMTTFLPTLVEFAESSEANAIRDRATEAVLTLANHLGRHARSDHDLPTIRYPALTRLSESIVGFNKHQNEQLIDAFLLATTWGDNDFRRIQQLGGVAYELICRRLKNSQHPGVMNLLSGFLRRRNLDERLATLMRQRNDDAFRDFFLNAIGTEPSAVVLKNLKVVGVPTCCRGGEALAESLGDDQLPALVQLYASAHGNHVETLHVIAATAERQTEICDSNAAFALSRCEMLRIESLLRAALLIAEGDETAVRQNENARLVARLIELLDHQDESVVDGVRRILEPLHAPAMMRRFAALRPRSRRLLGQVVVRIDPDAIQRVGDALRHPVLSRRLDAIAMADALAVVDLLSDSFSHISRQDHQESRMRAADALANAKSATTMSLLKDMTKLPQCPVRDVAVQAFRRRQETEAVAKNGTQTCEAKP